MTSWSRKTGRRRIRYRLSIRNVQAIIAVVGLALGVIVTALRFSDWARDYEYRMLIHASAEGHALEAASRDAQSARKHREVARLIARDWRLDGERWTYACAPSVVKKHPRLEAAWRQTLTLGEAERDDVLQELEYCARVSIRGAEYERERSAYEARLKEKYWRATSYPWMPLGPDSPPPVVYYPSN